MAGSSLLFASMGVCVKAASSRYSLGEIVMARGLVGVTMMFLLARARGVSLATRVPVMHLWRSAVGVASLALWFYGLGHLPLATAVTLNYMSSVWMAVFLVGTALLARRGPVDPRLVGTVLLGFVGVALVLRPTLDRNQLGAGLMGLASGVLSAAAYLQVRTLGRAGEPELRVVFYFSLGSAAGGLLLWLASPAAPHAHTAQGLGLLLATGLLATSAQVLLTRAYAIGKPLANASLQYLGIAFSFAYGVLLFHDPVTLFATAGILLIVAAGLAATLLRANALPASPDSILPAPTQEKP